ncbi:MAG: 3-coathanger stack domain-containing protein [Saprospiraceae bacterium]
MMKKIYILLVLIMLINIDLSAQCDGNGNQWAKSWVSCQVSINPNPIRGITHWILYEFNENHWIDSSHVWNANRNGESDTGLKDVIIDYSLDGNTWTELGLFTFAQGSESDLYQGFEGPIFGSQFIKKILITVQNTHGNGSCASLGEIQFQVDDSKCHGVVDVCGVCGGPEEATWYIDADGDGKGSSASTIQTCEKPMGYVDNTDDDCDSGELGWNDISGLFITSCNGCHIAASAGGLSLVSYASFSLGGNICGTSLKTENNLVSVITISEYNGCGLSISAPQMNVRSSSPITQTDLDKLQRWIDGGAPELCDDFCLENENVDSDFAMGTVGYFQARNQITSDAELDSATIITYDAGQEILLNSGFTVKIGGQFIAQIGGCDP